MSFKHKVIIDPMGNNLSLFWQFLNGNPGLIQGLDWDQIGTNVFRVDDDTSELIMWSLRGVVRFWQL